MGSLRALSLDIAGLSSGYHDTLSLESPISTMLQPQRSSVLPGRLSDVNTQFQPSSFRLTWQGLEKPQAAAERIPSETLQRLLVVLNATDFQAFVLGREIP